MNSTNKVFNPEFSKLNVSEILGDVWYGGVAEVYLYSKEDDVVIGNMVPRNVTTTVKPEFRDIIAKYTTDHDHKYVVVRTHVTYMDEELFLICNEGKWWILNGVGRWDVAVAAAKTLPDKLKFVDLNVVARTVFITELVMETALEDQTTQFCFNAALALEAEKRGSL